MIRHQTIAISIRNRLDVLSPLFEEEVVILVGAKEVFIAVGVVVDVIVGLWFTSLRVTCKGL
jgi:hypothetical protein